jgi:2-polyprenyl-6-methoxyphenol hydroxylase-like FAD-dependent oxidoreductase
VSGIVRSGRYDKRKSLYHYNCKGPVMRSAIVVGGGIGGLSAALGMHNAGWQVTVVERAAEFTPIGAGITLWPNALRALDELGLGDRLRPLLTPATAGLRDVRGRPIVRFDEAAFVRRLGKPLAGIHRANLIGLLRDALPADSLRAGTEVTAVTRDGDVTYGDGGTEHADLVVGADGIGSRVRAALWPEHAATTYSGSTAFRGVTDAPPNPEIGITWGPGVEFGIVPLAGGGRYWYTALVAAEGETHEDAKTYLEHRFSAWPSATRGLIDSTPADAILHHDIRVLARPLPTRVTGSVALLGDAAHAMTPFLGQGGCQAIEDAVVLAAAAARHDKIADALANYDAERRPRAHAIVKASERMGRLGHRLRNPLLVAARNAVLRRVPASVMTRATSGPADWTPPPLVRV